MGAYESLSSMNSRNHKTVALIDEKQVEYDEATLGRYTKDYIKWEYLGQGTIYSVDDVVQNGDIQLHFWRRID